jgi:hypothetical protein
MKSIKLSKCKSVKILKPNRPSYSYILSIFTHEISTIESIIKDQPSSLIRLFDQILWSTSVLPQKGLSTLYTAQNALFVTPSARDASVNNAPS